MTDNIAKSIYMRRNGHGCRPWSNLPADHKWPYLEDARAALLVLKAPTPKMCEAGTDCVIGCCNPDPDEANEMFQHMVSAAENGA